MYIAGEANEGVLIGGRTTHESKASPVPRQRYSDPGRADAHEAGNHADRELVLSGVWLPADADQTHACGAGVSPVHCIPAPERRSAVPRMCGLRWCISSKRKKIRCMFRSGRWFAGTRRSVNPEASSSDRRTEEERPGSWSFL